MRRALLVGAVALSVTVAACSGGGGSASRERPAPRTTTTTLPATTTTTRPADLNAVQATLTPAAPGNAPTAMATRAGDPALYVAEQGGRVLSVVNGGVATVLDLSGQVTAGGEQGLLGLTFSPDGTRMYVHYSDASGGDTVVDEYTFVGTPDASGGDTVVDEYTFVATPGGGGTADPATRRELLAVDQPQSNHNGGQLAFGPDDALYLGLGDGGGANDQGAGHAPEGNGQSPDTLLGKLVRIDPASGAAEIFATGLRNPWRFSFDRETDDLWIGDVGQNAWEEINRVPFSEARGANFGWPLLEGSHAFRTDSAPGTVLPTFEVDQATGACAIIGGFVYRGTRIPDLRGSYLFTDNCDGRIRAFTIDDTGTVVVERDLGLSVDAPTTFGEDNDGELYVASGTGGVFRIDPA